MMSTRPPLQLALLFPLLLLELACEQDSLPPLEVGKQFIRATREGATEEVFQLLEPAAQEKLVKMARLANAQSGTNQHFKPADLIAAGQDLPTEELADLQVVDIKGDKATLSLQSAEKKKQETIKLIRIKGKWRIRLPQIAQTIKP